MAGAEMWVVQLFSVPVTASKRAWFRLACPFAVVKLPTATTSPFAEASPFTDAVVPLVDIMLGAQARSVGVVSPGAGGAIAASRRRLTPRILVKLPPT